MRSLDFSNDLIIPAAIWQLRLTQPDVSQPDVPPRPVTVVALLSTAIIFIAIYLRASLANQRPITKVERGIKKEH
jgi:hypothetical protein